mgnify:CR=1 FL=1
MSPSSTRAGAPRRSLPLWQRRWFRITALLAAVPVVLLFGVAGYYYVTFGRLIDQQLHGERQRVFPRIFARPLELRSGQAITERQLVDRLNDIGYAERTTAEKPVLVLGHYDTVHPVGTVERNKLRVEGERLIATGEGNGPVNALDEIGRAHV